MNACSESGNLKAHLDELSPDELGFLVHDWQVWARDDQLAPLFLDDETGWRVWMILGGRGSGKTRAGAEWVRSKAIGELSCERFPARIALIGKTLNDVRNVMVEGVSGLLAIHPDCERPAFEPSKRRLTWSNGAVAELYSADETETVKAGAILPRRSG